MIHFQWPWLFLALPLPWLVRHLLPAAAASGAVLRVPFLDELANGPAPAHRQRGRLPVLLAALAWLLLVAAAARPQWLGKPLDLPLSGRDLMLAVDLSGSMATRDFEWRGELFNRLQAIKKVAGNFIDRRVGDRVGLILFGSKAYLQAPLTFDRRTVQRLLDEAAIGLAGKQTAIGDAIGLAIKRLRNQNAASRVLILLTDGASNAGDVSPLTAAKLAAQAGLTIYTIGIGADRMEVETLFGTQQVNPSTDLDEKTLRAIANATGGHYFRARDVDELNGIYRRIDQLQPTEQEKRLFRPVTPLYTWPLAGTLLLSLLLVMTGWSRRQLS